MAWFWNVCLSMLNSPCLIYLGCLHPPTIPVIAWVPKPDGTTSSASLCWMGKRPKRSKKGAKKEQKRSKKRMWDWQESNLRHFGHNEA